MSNFKTSPHFPVLKHRTPDKIPALPKEIVEQYIQLPQAHPMSVIEACIMGTTMVPPPRPLIRYLPPAMPIQLQFDILEARLDTLYRKCESVIEYQGSCVSEIITYTQRLLALAPDLTTLGSPAVHHHREKGRKLKQRIASVKLEMSRVHGAFFSEARAPLLELQQTLSPLHMPFWSRLDTIQARIEDGERYLIIYDRVSNTRVHSLWYELFTEIRIPLFQGYKYIFNKPRSRKSKGKYGSELQRLLYSLIRRRGLPSSSPFADGTFLAYYNSNYLQFASINTVWEPNGVLEMRLAREESTRAVRLASLIRPQPHSAHAGTGSPGPGDSGIVDAVHIDPDINDDEPSGDGTSTSDRSDIDSLDGSNISLSPRPVVDGAISHGWPYIPPLNYVGSDDDSDLETE